MVVGGVKGREGTLFVWRDHQHGRAEIPNLACAIKEHYEGKGVAETTWGFDQTHFALSHYNRHGVPPETSSSVIDAS